MAFKVDYSDTTGNRQVPEGEYEVFVSSVGFDKTARGTEYINIKLTVRADVQQPEIGEDIQYPLWKSRPENRKNSDIDGIPSWRIQSVSRAVSLPDGETIATLDDWFRMINGKPMRVTVEQDKEGRAQVRKVEETMYPKMTVGMVQVDDEEAPF